MTIHATNIGYALAALVIATVASVVDLKTRRIPNRLTGYSLLAGLTLHFALGGWGQLGVSLLGGMIGGVIFLLFYLAGGMGAGDVKLMAAVACLVGYHSVLELLVGTAIMGGIFALALAIYRKRLKETVQNIGALLLHHRLEGLTPHPELNLKNNQTLRLPYAIAIASGCFITLFSQLQLR